MQKWPYKEVCIMNIRINGLRVGILTAMLAMGTSACKKGPYRAVPKESIPAATEHVLDSFSKIGKEVQNNPNYKYICSDTIRFKDAYVKNPQKLQRFFNTLEDTYNSPSDIDDVSYLFRNERKYVVSDSQLFEDSKNRKYIAISAYEKLDK